MLSVEHWWRENNFSVGLLKNKHSTSETAAARDLVGVGTRNTVETRGMIQSKRCCITRGAIEPDMLTYDIEPEML